VDLEIRRRNIEFWIHRYWSAELGKVIEGAIPDAFKGRQFGPVLRTFILYQYYKNRVPHGKIRRNLADWGIVISAGTINAILNDLPEEFAEDLGPARGAALRMMSQVHIDETGAKFNGQNYYTFSVSNRFYTQYATGPEKNRWSSVAAILGGAQKFLVDDTAVTFIAQQLKKPAVTNCRISLKGTGQFPEWGPPDFLKGDHPISNYGDHFLS
jgi:hypothetical protein